MKASSAAVDAGEDAEPVAPLRRADCCSVLLHRRFLAVGLSVVRLNRSPALAGSSGEPQSRDQRPVEAGEAEQDRMSDTTIMRMPDLEEIASL